MVDGRCSDSPLVWNHDRSLAIPLQNTIKHQLAPPAALSDFCLLYFNCISAAAQQPLTAFHKSGSHMTLFLRSLMQFMTCSKKLSGEALLFCQHWFPAAVSPLMKHVTTSRSTHSFNTTRWKRRDEGNLLSEQKPLWVDTLFYCISRKEPAFSCTVCVPFSSCCLFCTFWWWRGMKQVDNFIFKID